jgi:hypothetical protein
MAMATMDMVSAGRFSVVTFHLRQCPQGVTALIFEKTPILGSTGLKLDQLTVGTSKVEQNYVRIFNFTGRITLN